MSVTSDVINDLVHSLSCRIPAYVIDRLELVRKARYSHGDDGEVLRSGVLNH